MYTTFREVGRGQNKAAGRGNLPSMGGLEPTNFPYGSRDLIHLTADFRKIMLVPAVLSLSQWTISTIYLLN